MKKTIPYLLNIFLLVFCAPLFSQSTGAANPSDGKIYIHSNKSFNQFLDINIYDAIGKAIYNSEGEVRINKSIEIPNFSAGIYFIQILIEEKLLYKGKIIIK